MATKLLKIKTFSGINEENLVEGIRSYLNKHSSMPPYFGTGYGRFVSVPESWNDVRENFEFDYFLSDIPPKKNISYNCKKRKEMITCLGIQLIPQIKLGETYQTPWEIDEFLVDFQSFSSYLGKHVTLNICKQIFRNSDIRADLNPFEEKIPTKYLEEMVRVYLDNRKEKSIANSKQLLKLGAYLFDKNSYDELSEFPKSPICNIGLCGIQNKLESHLRTLI